MNIYVGNLPYSVDSRELREAFEAYGAVSSAEVIFDRRTKRSRGYGFVEMDNDQDARSAINALNGSDYQGRELRVDESKPKSEKTERRESVPRSDDTGAAAPAQSTAPAEGGGVVGFFKRLFG